MDGLRMRTVDTWKSCFGMCVVCGSPMGLESGRKVKKENADDDDWLSEEKLKNMLERDNTQFNHADSLCENSIRVALFRYNLLCKMEDCHVIDKYTIVKPQSGSEFFATLKKNAYLATLMGGDFEADLQAGGVYNQAVLVCSRLVEKVTVPGCRECNAAMNRSIVHADVVYRCFSRTATAEIEELESRDKKNRTISKANKVKKWIQQVAFYFAPPTDANPRWTLKTDHDIRLDTAIYRCVANLCMWGRTGYARFRMIAVFYGAWYIFHAKSLRDLMPFLRWHIFVFREYYMSQFSQHCTWFGMTQPEAAALFDLTRRGEGVVWMQMVRKRLDACGQTVAGQHQGGDSAKIDTVEKAMLAAVSNERTLLHFACQRHGVEVGLRTLFRFLLYNIRDPMCGLLERRVNAFIDEATQVVRKERRVFAEATAAAAPQAAFQTRTRLKPKPNFADVAGLAESVWEMRL